MKVAVELLIDIKDGLLPDCVARLAGSGSFLSRIVSVSRDESFCRYVIDLVYNDAASYKRCIASFEEEPGSFRIVTLKNSLEELLSGGFIRMKGLMKIDTPEDYEMNVLGVHSVARERILESETPYSLTGVGHNVAVINAISGKNERSKQMSASHYAESEIVCALLSKFADMNGFPIMIRYDLTEDLIKIISSIEPGFSAIRINHCDDDDNSDIYESLSDTTTLPFVSHSHDEIPVFVLSAIMAMTKKHRYKIKDCNIGFIGLDAGSIRLARLCIKIGCMRVLGFDNNEKSMLFLERQKGLATTPDHIFGNADIVVIHKNQFSDTDLSKMRPGNVVISLLDDDEPLRVFRDRKSCREIVSGEWVDPALLYPGMLRGLIASGRLTLDDDDIIALAETLSVIETPDGKTLPNIFSDIHERVEEKISKRQKISHQ